MGTAFSYQAVGPDGRRSRGRELASSADALTRQLAARGLLVLEVEPAGSVSGTMRVAPRLTGRDALDVARSLGALLGAGLPVPRALAAAETMVAATITPVLGDVRSRVERGDPLATALAAHPALFSPVALGLVKAGERSGQLAGAFARLAAQLEREQALRARLLSASIYPLLLAVAGGCAILVLLLFVLPRFAELLEGTGMVLPRSTALLLSVAAAFREGWPLLVALSVAGGLLLVWVRASESGQRLGARLLLRTPGVAAVRRQLLAAQFARVLGVLSGAGAPLLIALDATGESLSDPEATAETARVRSRVREGAALHRALAESALFPPVLGRLAALGEETGRLSEFLTRAADLLEDRTERALQRLVTLAEPAMIVVFGGLVGFVALSLLQAVYSINVGSFR